MNTEKRISDMVEHKIHRSSNRVNLGNFNRQLKELGCTASRRREIRNEITRRRGI